MHNTNSQASGSSSARRRRQSDNTWNNSSPESVAHELARKVAKEENRSLNASTTTSASGSQRPHRGNPSRANETHPQQASTSSESPLTKSTATKRKRAADERSSALKGGERSSKKKRMSPQPIGDALESKRPRASSQSQESARNLPQVADSPMYDYTVPWVDSYWMFSDDSSATGAQAGWSSTRGRGDVNAFHDSSAFSPFTVDTLPHTSATPSEDSSTPLSSSSAYPAELLQVIDFTAYVAGPSTTRLPSSSPLQHTLPWNHAPPSFSSSVTSQAVHEPLSFPGSVPAPAIGSALSDAPSPWSAPSAAASGCRDAGNVAQPSRHAHTSPHALDRTSRVGPSGSRGPSLLQSQTDGAASSQSKKPPGKTSSRVKSGQHAISGCEDSRTNAVQPAARSSLPSVGPSSAAARTVQPSQRSPVGEPSFQMPPAPSADSDDPSLRARIIEQRHRRRSSRHWLDKPGLQRRDHVSAAVSDAQPLRPSPPSSRAAGENTQDNRPARKLPVGREAQRSSLVVPLPQTLRRGSLAGRPSQLPRAQSARSPTDAAQEAFLQSLSSEEWRLIRGERPVGMEGWDAGIGGVGEDCWVGVVGADGFIYQPMLPIPCRGRCPMHRHDTHGGASGRDS